MTTGTMERLVQLLCMLGAMVLALLVGAWLDRRMKARFAKAEAELAAEESAADAEARQEEQHWKTLYLEECRKREEVLRMITGIQAERDRWKDIFWQCSGEHGVAQEYMMRVNQHFAQALKRKGDVKMNDLWQSFKDRYGDAAKPEIAGRIARGQPGLPVPGEPAGSVGEVGVPSPAVVVEENAAPPAVVVAKPDPNA